MAEWSGHFDTISPLIGYAERIWIWHGSTSPRCCSIVRGAPFERNQWIGRIFIALWMGIIVRIVSFSISIYREIERAFDFITIPSTCIPEYHLNGKMEHILLHPKMNLIEMRPWTWTATAFEIWIELSIWNGTQRCRLGRRSKQWRIGTCQNTRFTWLERRVFFLSLHSRPFCILFVYCSIGQLPWFS